MSRTQFIAWLAVGAGLWALAVWAVARWVEEVW